MEYVFTANLLFAFVFMLGHIDVSSGTLSKSDKKVTKSRSKESTGKLLENNDELKELDIESLKSVFGMEGKEKDGQFKVTVPQNDLNVMVDGFIRFDQVKSSEVVFHDHIVQEFSMQQDV